MNETSAVSSVKFTLWIGLRCDHSVGFSLDWTVTCVCVSECILFFNRNDRYCTVSGINTRFYTLFLLLCTPEG